MASGASAAAIEYSEEERGTLSVPIRFKSASVPEGAEVSIQCRVDGKDQKKVRLTPQRDGSFIGAITVPKGKFERRYIITGPGETVRFIPEKGYDIVEAKEAKGDVSSGSKKSPELTEVEKEVRGRMKDILHSLRTQEGAEGLHAAIDDMEHWLETRGQTSDQKGVLFSALVVLTREADWLPAPIKHEFRDALPAPRSFDEWKERVEKGSRNFRKSVFLKLKQSKEAREYFGIREAQYNHENPLGSEKYNRVFSRLCAEAGDLSDSAEIIGHVMDRFSGVPATNPAITKRLRDKQQEYLKRIQSEQGEGGILNWLKSMSPKRLGKGADVAFQSIVILGGMFIGASIPVVAATLYGKEFLQELLGVSTDDIVQRSLHRENLQVQKEFNTLLKRNNIAMQKRTVKESLWAALKRAIPIAGLFVKQRRPKPYSGDFPEQIEAPEEKAEQFIRAAVETARK